MRKNRLTDIHAKTITSAQPGDRKITPFSSHFSVIEVRSQRNFNGQYCINYTKHKAWWYYHLFPLHTGACFFSYWRMCNHHKFFFIHWLLAYQVSPVAPPQSFIGAAGWIGAWAGCVACAGAAATAGGLDAAAQSVSAGAAQSIVALNPPDWMGTAATGMLSEAHCKYRQWINYKYAQNSIGWALYK